MLTPLPPAWGVAGGLFGGRYNLVFMLNGVFACGASVMDKLTEVL